MVFQEEYTHIHFSTRTMHRVFVQDLSGLPQAIPFHRLPESPGLMRQSESNLCRVFVLMSSSTLPSTDMV